MDLKRIGWLFLLSLLVMPVNSFGLETLTLQQSENKLKELFAELASGNTDPEKSATADSIANLLYTTLHLPGSFEYAFATLEALGKITSRDQHLRIFTWNVPASDGTNTYYGFLQFRSGNDHAVRVYRLTDSRSSISDPDMATLTRDNWYGCLVYEIIDKKQAGITSYTLLGYNPENRFISKKVIDLLWMNDQHEPVFGKPVFHYQKRMQCRIIFEYSAKVTMSLKWNDKMDMIVFDHLSPAASSFAGNYQYYGPDLSYDGLRFDKGIWESVEDIDVRTSHQSPVTNHQSPVTSHQSPVTSHQSPVTKKNAIPVTNIVT
jgi:hypothetical protein